MQTSGWTRIYAAFLIMAAVHTAHADDAAELTAKLKVFLDGVSSAEVHDAFWANDLVYTSSSGTRTDKATIMAGFESEDTSNDSGEESPVYSAEDIDVRTYGSTAIVAFRLIATNPDGSVQEYLNTGTFLNRNGDWQVIAWQATRIP